MSPTSPTFLSVEVEKKKQRNFKNLFIIFTNRPQLAIEVLTYTIIIFTV